MDFHAGQSLLWKTRKGNPVSAAGRAGSGVAAGDAGLVEVILGHFHIHLAAGGNADEIFAQLAGDRREDFVAMGQIYPKPGAGQHLGDGSRKFDGLFFWHGETQNFAGYPAIAAPKINLFTHEKRSGHSPLISYIQRTVYEE
jgi:hypothetical protein